MVRILANGDVVPDDDPRARQAVNRSNTRTQPQTRNMYNPQQGQHAVPGQQMNIFQSVNQRLLSFGIPRWNIGQTVIEPLVSVGFLVALVFFGLPGVIFGGVLFAVSKWSQDGPPEFLSGFLGNNPPTGRRGDGRGGGGGGGSGGSGSGGSGSGNVGGFGGRTSGGHRLGHT